MIVTGYVRAEAIKPLRALVRQQRRLEKRAVKAQLVLDQEKACRDAINAVLVEAGCGKGEGVLVDGYEVVHHERAGQARVNADKLRGAGVSEIDIQFAIEVGKCASYATVRPAKGAKVAA